MDKIICGMVGAGIAVLGDIAIIVAVAGALILTGCSGISLKTIDKDGVTTYYKDNSCIVQNSSTVFGLDLQIFDVLGSGGSSPTKIRFGYVSTQNQITPKGASSSLTKEYNLDTDTYEVKMSVDTERK